MLKKIFLALFLFLMVISCGNDNSSGPTNENSSDSHGLEIPCDSISEGMIIKPSDSDVEHICKDGSWIANNSSSSSTNDVILSASEGSSSSVNFVILSSDSYEKSSSSVIASETKQSSSSSTNNVILSASEESSSSGNPVMSSGSHEESSSSSEETKLYLCDDGETHVLNPANCEKESSSSVAVASSSSDNKPFSSSSVVQESSSSEMSSSSEKIDSSSSKVESSSSEATTQSSSENVEESSSSEDSVESSSSEIIAVSSSSLNSVYDAENNTLTDLRDGQVYKTVTIGSQVWMAENLNYLPKDTVGTVFAGLSICGGGEIGSMQEGNCSVYGRLYEKNINAYDHYNENICPDDWNVPTLTQWKTLVNYVGGNEIAGNVLKSNNNSNWSGTNLTDKYGFSATSAGFFYKTKGFNYKNNEKMAVFTIHNLKSYESNAIRIYDTQDTVNFQGFGNGYYLAVRCIKD